ncbi:MAG TPA: hypothetical protein VF399_12985 [bacterium]
MTGIILAALLCGQISSVKSASEVTIKIQTSQAESYHLVTKAQPLTVTAQGPTWLRVYTRIPWPAEDKGVKGYKLIMQENDVKEKFVTFETERSKVARLGSTRLSKWRSFYINVPPGENMYRFILWTAPADSVLLKFAYESPAQWSDIVPAEYGEKLQAVEDEKIINYYETTRSKPIMLEITGPQKLKIISRLAYAMDMNNEQVYSIVVKENSRIVKNSTFRAYRSETTSYQNRPDVVPSNPHSFYVNVKKGKHRFEITVGGSGTESAGLRCLVKQK